jgi:muconolactone D-isomerase
MLFLVHMKLRPSSGPAEDDAPALREKERARAAELQEAGTWVHLWRVTGRPENVSVFNVSSNEQLHDVLSSLPMFPFSEMAVTPLSTHPSAVR